MARLSSSQVQTEELAPFVQSDEGVTFSRGIMRVHGRIQIPEQTQHWLSSNELAQYTTVAWRDSDTGERRTSCNCPGWTHSGRKRGKPKRECCHTKDMEGIGPCYDRQKVEPEPIRLRTVRDVQKHVATVGDTRELRAIMLD